MDIRTLTASLSVGPQVSPGDVPTLAKLGYRAIICNRPDGEGADQPTFEEIAVAAREAGLEARYLPIVAGKVRDEDADAFDKTLAELPGPVLAYCRTGTRSTTLWSLSRADKLELPKILATAKAAGYDMAGVVRR
ncbi:MAG: TIGR01244 family sulfur transferase, partial [Litorimonas sp.]